MKGASLQTMQMGVMIGFEGYVARKRLDESRVDRVETMNIPDQEIIECRSGGVVDAAERGVRGPSGEWQVRVQRAQAHVFVGKSGALAYAGALINFLISEGGGTNSTSTSAAEKGVPSITSIQSFAIGLCRMRVRSIPA